MKTPASTPVGLASLIAGLTAIVSFAGLVVLNTGGTLGAGPFRFGLGPGYKESAQELMARGAPEDLRLAEARMHDALALAPYDNAARLNLAIVDQRRHGRLTPAGLEQLRNSYSLAPVDPQIARSRMRLALANWRQLDGWTRSAAAHEIGAVHGLAGQAPNVAAELKATRDSSGRVAAAILLQQLQSRRESARP